MEAWLAIVLMVAALLIGLILGFFLARWWFKRYLKKNPPITENQIRTMFTSMGRKPSEKQVRQVMKQMEENR